MYQKNIAKIFDGHMTVEYFVFYFVFFLRKLASANLIFKILFKIELVIPVFEGNIIHDKLSEF